MEKELYPLQSNISDNIIGHNETFKFDETVRSFDKNTDKLRKSHINFEKDITRNYVGKMTQLNASKFNFRHQETDVLNVKDRKSQTPMPENKMKKEIT